MARDGSLAGFARLGLRAGRAWWWTAVGGRNRVLVAVRDHDVDPPRGGGLEIRASGLWAEPVLETPFEHWSLGLEAMAVALGDPADAYTDEWGEPVPLGFDLEWEAMAGPALWPAPPDPTEGGGRYGQPCQVNGEVLVGRERLLVAGFGAREHGWGPHDWWGAGRSWAAAHLEDGSALGPGPDVRATVELDGRSLVSGARLVAGEGTAYRLEPVAHAPFQIPGGPGGAVSRLARAVCRVERDDGTAGWGWAERLQPASSTTGA